MKDEYIIILIIIGVLILGLVGFYVANPYIISNLRDGITNVTEKENTKSNYTKVKYNVKINNENSDDEKVSLIKVEIDYTIDDKNNKKEIVLEFDKASGKLLNENIVDELEDEEIKRLVKETIDKCIDEKLYQIDKLNMSYYSSYSTNGKTEKNKMDFSFKLYE